MSRRQQNATTVTDLDSRSTRSLESLCRSLGLPKASRTDMIENITAQMSLGRGVKRRRSARIAAQVNKRRRVTQTPQIVAQYRRRMEAATEIAQWWRRVKWIYVNDTDFLTLEAITVPPFRLVEDSMHVYRFHPMSLATWFVREGNFVNPYTRTPLNVIEIKRLDKAVVPYDENFVCLAEEYERITAERKQQREHQQTCELLHNESLRVLNDILVLTEGQEQMSAVLFQLCHVVLPRYYHTFQQLYSLDYSFACDSIIYVCHALEQLWQDERIANTRERCYVIETVQHSLVTFCTQLLPVFAAILPEINHEHIVENGPAYVR